MSRQAGSGFEICLQFSLWHLVCFDWKTLPEVFSAVEVCHPYLPILVGGYAFDTILGNVVYPYFRWCKHGAWGNYLLDGNRDRALHWALTYDKVKQKMGCWFSYTSGKNSSSSMVLTWLVRCQRSNVATETIFSCGTQLTLARLPLLLVLPHRNTIAPFEKKIYHAF